MYEPLIASHEDRGATLDRRSRQLCRRPSRIFDVSGDFVPLRAGETRLSFRRCACGVSRCVSMSATAVITVMPAAGEQVQAFGDGGVIFCLGENAPAAGDDGVGRQERPRGSFAASGREPPSPSRVAMRSACARGSSFAANAFVDVGGHRRVGLDADLFEQRKAARTGARQDRDRVRSWIMGGARSMRYLLR